jgi:hypothetical protein
MRASYVPVKSVAKNASRAAGLAFGAPNWNGVGDEWRI